VTAVVAAAPELAAVVAAAVVLAAVVVVAAVLVAVLVARAVTLAAFAVSAVEVCDEVERCVVDERGSTTSAVEAAAPVVFAAPLAPSA
jgi:hypothetical protein